MTSPVDTFGWRLGQDISTACAPGARDHTRPAEPEKVCSTKSAGTRSAWRLAPLTGPSSLRLARFSAPITPSSAQVVILHDSG